MRKALKLIYISSLFFLVSFAYGQKTSVENLNQYHLENGLTLFTLENHNVPLVYIDFAFKSGSSAQEAETSGFFQLYEYLTLFGNPLCPDYNSIQEYLENLGATSLSTDIKSDYVYYNLTVPSYESERALAFLKATVLHPSITEEKVDLVKNLYIQNIKEYTSQQSTIYKSYQASKLFPSAPYKTDEVGSIQAIEEANLDLLLDFQSKNFIPSKAALFIGGDIDSKEIYQLVKRIFSGWEDGDAKKDSDKIQQNPSPLGKTEKAVYPFAEASRQIAQIKIQFRGPDTDFNLNDTYAADYLCFLMRDPDGPFKKALVSNKKLGIPDISYISGNYTTKRSDGLIEFTAYVSAPENLLPQRADLLLNYIQNDVMPAIANTADLYKKNSVKEIAQNLKDTDLLLAETPESFLSNLRFWWASTGSDYYFSYNKKMDSVKQEDMKNFIEKYISGKNALVSIIVNPEVYQKHKTEYLAAGYEEISESNGLWQNKAAYKPDADKIASMKGKGKKGKIYTPSKAVKKEFTSKESSDIKKYTLKNGIPVYVKNEEAAAVDSIYIASKVGISNLTDETSGLTSALFTLMGRSSKNYSKKERQKLSYKYMAPIKYRSENEGAALYVTVLDSYWKNILPLLTDSFINPAFTDDAYDSMIKEYTIALESWENTPDNKLNIRAYKEIYKDHPYLPLNTPSPLSICNITKENLQALHKKVLNSKKIFVVATGKINGKALVKELNKSLGNLAVAEDEEEKGIPQIDFEKISQRGPILIEDQHETGKACAVRIFQTPASNHSDHVASLMAASIYTDMLNKIVSSRYKAASSAFSSIFTSLAPVGQEYFKSISNLKEFSLAAEEARTLMASGKVIKTFQGENYYNYVPLASKLESYKNRFITATYMSLQKAAAQGWAIESYLLEYGDPDYSKKFTREILNLTEEDIQRVFKKYWIDSPSTWFAVVNKEEKDLIEF